MTEQEWRDRFGARLADLIATRGCTRREFAEETGMSEKAIDHYIHGRRSPNVISLVNLARFFDYPIDKLVDFGEQIEK